MASIKTITEKKLNAERIEVAKMFTYMMCIYDKDVEMASWTSLSKTMKDDDAYLNFCYITIDYNLQQILTLLFVFAEFLSNLRKEKENRNTNDEVYASEIDDEEDASEIDDEEDASEIELEFYSYQTLSEYLSDFTTFIQDVQHKRKWTQDMFNKAKLIISMVHKTLKCAMIIKEDQVETLATLASSDTISKEALETEMIFKEFKEILKPVTLKLFETGYQVKTLTSSDTILGEKLNAGSDDTKAKRIEVAKMFTYMMCMYDKDVEMASWISISKNMKDDGCLNFCCTYFQYYLKEDQVVHLLKRFAEFLLELRKENRNTNDEEDAGAIELELYSHPILSRYLSYFKVFIQVVQNQWKIWTQDWTQDRFNYWIYEKHTKKRLKEKEMEKRLKLEKEMESEETMLKKLFALKYAFRPEIVDDYIMQNGFRFMTWNIKNLTPNPGSLGLWGKRLEYIATTLCECDADLIVIQEVNADKEENEKKQDETIAAIVESLNAKVLDRWEQKRPYPTTLRLYSGRASGVINRKGSETDKKKGAKESPTDKKKGTYQCYGFIYKSSVLCINQEESEILNIPIRRHDRTEELITVLKSLKKELSKITKVVIPEEFGYYPYLLSVTLNQTSCTKIKVVTCHLSTKLIPNLAESIALQFRCLELLDEGGDNVILAGDFNVDESGSSEYNLVNGKDLTKRFNKESVLHGSFGERFEPCLEGPIPTNLYPIAKEKMHNDNIWISGNLEYAENSRDIGVDHLTKGSNCVIDAPKEIKRFLEHHKEFFVQKEKSKHVTYRWSDHKPVVAAITFNNVKSR